MLVQVKTDNHIDGNARLHEWIRAEIEGSLERFAPQLTRAEATKGAKPINNARWKCVSPAWIPSRSPKMLAQSKRLSMPR